jgi:hypothetical protein
LEAAGYEITDDPWGDGGFPVSREAVGRLSTEQIEVLLAKGDVPANVQAWLSAEMAERAAVKTVTPPSVDPVSGQIDVDEAVAALDDLTPSSVQSMEELGSSSRLGDPRMAAIRALRGFDSAPQIVDRQGLDDLVETGGVALFRGEKDWRYVEQFRSGDAPYSGRGILGNGTYFATSRGGAEPYSVADDDGAVLESTLLQIGLRPDARIVTSDQLAVLRRELAARLGRERGFSDVDGPRDSNALFTDDGRLAAALGFDAVVTSDSLAALRSDDIVNVLNRAATVVVADDGGVRPPSWLDLMDTPVAEQRSQIATTPVATLGTWKQLLDALAADAPLTDNERVLGAEIERVYELKSLIDQANRLSDGSADKPVNATLQQITERYVAALLPWANSEIAEPGSGDLPEADRLQLQDDLAALEQVGSLDDRSANLQLSILQRRIAKLLEATGEPDGVVAGASTGKGKYTKPELRDKLKAKIMAGSKGGKPGQWSARKAQLLAQEYEAKGGGYRGGKSATQRSLSKWSREEWTTSSGKPSEGKRRYLPKAAWEKLTPAQAKATNAKKAAGNRKGKQFVANTEVAERAARLVREGRKRSNKSD